MKPYTYLMVNFFTIIICLIFSFHPKIRFDRYFKPFLIASVVVATPFLLWDIWFTSEEIWWFNDEYLLGKRLAGMPVEEWMFFLCIPFSCVFTYFCLSKFLNLEWAERRNRMLAAVVLAVCLCTAIVFNERAYTVVTMAFTAICIVTLFYILKFRHFGKASLTYFILMAGFIPVNGVLTGTGLENPIVNYNPSEIIGFRVLTIPIEDFVYGYALIMLNIYVFDLLTNKAHTR